MRKEPRKHGSLNYPFRNAFKIVRHQIIINARKIHILGLQVAMVNVQQLNENDATNDTFGRALFNTEKNRNNRFFLSNRLSDG